MPQQLSIESDRDNMRNAKIVLEQMAKDAGVSIVGDIVKQAGTRKKYAYVAQTNLD
jgi:hypothetical protein